MLKVEDVPISLSVHLSGPIDWSRQDLGAADETLAPADSETAHLCHGFGSKCRLKKSP